MHLPGAAGLLGPGARLLDVVVPQVGQHALHSRGREGLGHAEPDARGSSGDERDLALDVLHSPTPPSQGAF